MEESMSDKALATQTQPALPRLTHHASVACIASQFNLFRLCEFYFAHFKNIFLHTVLYGGSGQYGIINYYS